MPLFCSWHCQIEAHIQLLALVNCPSKLRTQLKGRFEIPQKKHWALGAFGSLEVIALAIALAIARQFPIAYYFCPSALGFELGSKGA